MGTTMTTINKGRQEIQMLPHWSEEAAINKSKGVRTPFQIKLIISISWLGFIVRESNGLYDDINLSTSYKKILNNVTLCTPINAQILNLNYKIKKTLRPKSRPYYI